MTEKHTHLLQAHILARSVGRAKKKKKKKKKKMLGVEAGM